MEYRIMIVEDDESIARLLSAHIEKYGYKTIKVDDFDNILDLFIKTNLHLVLLDINLPKYDGYYWCRKIRQISTNPIILISARDGEMDQVMGIESGADDYITKPFYYDVVIAKIKSQLRRCYGEFAPDKSEERKVELEGLILYPERPELHFKGKATFLTKKEAVLIEILMDMFPKAVSREILMEKLWDDQAFIDENTLVYRRLGGFESENNTYYFIFLSSFLLVAFLLYRYFSHKGLYDKLNKVPEKLEDTLSSAGNNPLSEGINRLLRAQYNLYQGQIQTYKRKQAEHLTFIHQWVHQMKTPISVIELILQEREGEPYVENIRQEIERIGRGLNMALNMARLDSFEHDFTVETVFLSSLVREVINEQKRYFIRKGVYPEVKVDMDLSVKSDKKWLKFILEQLIVNAIKYTEGENKKVTVAAYGSIEGTSVRIIFTD